ncbi:MAG: hypothetical protein IPP06_11655 [Saprospiraceae bacterium]|nr:hypothetical protein [Candidatus Vicinibacter affinis]
MRIKFPISAGLTFISFIGVGYYLYTGVIFFNNTSIHLPSILIVLLLMPINWGLESLKIYQKFNLNYSFKDCVRITLKGLGLSLVTPFGLGAYVGRALFEEQDKRDKLLRASVYASYAQSIVTFGIGLPAFIMFRSSARVAGLSEFNTYLVTNTMLFAGMAFMCWFFLMDGKNILLNLYLRNTSILIFDAKFYSTFTSLIKLSFLRYLVFGFQYLVLLMPFYSESWSELILPISIIFMFQTMLVVPPLLSGLLRGGVAAFILSPLGIDYTVCLGLASTLFLINLILPALAGSFILFSELRTQYRIKLLTEK